MDLKELLKKKMGKDKVKPMDEKEKMAKSSVLDELLAAADEAMGGGLKDLKKVTVVAPSKEGLEDGLEKAKELTAEQPEAQDDEEKEEDAESDDMLSKSGDLSSDDRAAKKAAFKEKMAKLMAGK
jgi:hypothetical protein